MSRDDPRRVSVPLLQHEASSDAHAEAAHAARFVKLGCMAAAFGTLCGAVATPFVAGVCCRRALIATDCWVWGIVSIGTLVYFLFLSSSNAPEDASKSRKTYAPVNVDEPCLTPVGAAKLSSIGSIGERTESVETVAEMGLSLIADSSDRFVRSLMSPRRSAVSPRRGVDAGPEPEPQQLVPTRDTSMQTDPYVEQAQPRGADRSRTMRIPTLMSWTPKQPPIPSDEKAKGGCLPQKKKRRFPGLGLKSSHPTSSPVDSSLPRGKESPPPPYASDDQPAADSSIAADSDALNEEDEQRTTDGASDVMVLAGRMHPVCGATASGASRCSATSRCSAVSRISSCTMMSAKTEASQICSHCGFDMQERLELEQQLEQVALMNEEPVSGEGTGEEPSEELEPTSADPHSKRLDASTSTEAVNPPVNTEPLPPPARPAWMYILLTGLTVAGICGMVWSLRLGDMGAARPAGRHAPVMTKWHTGEWSPCKSECGRGKRSRTVYCINGNRSKCEKFNGPAPPEDMRCSNYTGCRWETGQWGKCDATCGAGKLTRKVSCSNGEIQDCLQNTSMPPEIKACSSSDGCKWAMQPWTKCSNHCGFGKVSRMVSCANGPLDSCKEHGDRPQQEKPCHDLSGCVWKHDDWSSCSNICGSGKQERNVTCANGAAADCKATKKPPRLERECHEFGGCKWKISVWSPCSTKCGAGIQHREVSCANGKLQDCLENSVLPLKEQACTDYGGCQWKTGNWSPCVSQCGNGKRLRNVSCANGATGDCQQGPHDQPAAAEPCFNVANCKWAAGSWGPCSNVCGEGRQFRLVHCSNGKDKDCAEHGAPPQNGRACKEMSGCTPLIDMECECSSGDAVLSLAGAMNAVCGWVGSFAILYEMVSRSAAPTWSDGLHGGTASLLSPPAVLLAGLGALAASSALRTGVTHCSESCHRALLSSGQLAVGLMGLALAAVSLLIFGRPIKPKSMRCVSGVVLLLFCVIVVFMASGISLGEGSQKACDGPACVTARRLRGFLLRV